MKRILHRLTIGAAIALTAVVLGSVPGGRAPMASIADAAGSCPTTIRVNGSTTVGPITVASQAPFEALYAPGTSMSIVQNGSGNGINDLTAGNADVAMSSKPLNSTEQNGKYTYQIGRDAFVIGVQDSPAMAFLSAGMVKAHLTQIYSAGDGTTGTWPGGILALDWDELVPAIPGAPHTPIVPRMRITGSGSRPDFNSSIGVSAANEDATNLATGLPRLAESLHMADAAENNVNQIVYTSLSQVASHPGMRVVAIDGLIPSESNIETYALPRSLFMATRDIASVPRIDDSRQVRADDYVNFIRGPQGAALIAAEGYVVIPPAPVPPIPDWDVNLSGAVTLSDLGAVSSRWGQTSTCKGWIRADGNNDGRVSLGDIGTVTSHWGQDGLICDAAHLCQHPGGPQ